ncbi:shikimate dehydrogenase family protein [Brevibacterium atlanticum]|uniref:shikimate dehydrogenase family protein n=1 Tax=Brevibacterium atlanticum TaxID=2697563 RepID=UPI0014241A40|nr:shikimate dehydrogenase [Brevibacterium atlanticum]
MRILAAVLGRPIDHSKSPLLHRAAFAALGLTTSEYGRVDLGADELEDFLDSHPDETGFSLTMPLKDRLVELAAERGWSIDDTAALTGAGNTVARSGEQVQVANTDVRGIVRAIAPHLGPAAGEESRSAGAGRATILGAGATAASALVACRDLGITAVEFLVRSPDRARRVVELSERIGLTATVAPLERIGPSAVVISTLPAEAAPDLEWDVSFTAGRDHSSGENLSGVALDVAYADASSFLAAAAAHGLRPVDGTAMLVEQAVAQSEMFVAAAATSTSLALPTGQELRDRISEAMYSALRDTAAAVRD